MTMLPTRQERTDAEFRILQFAENLAGSCSFAQAVVTARGALPTDAAIVDNFFAATSTATPRPAVPTSTSRQSAHDRIVALAETARASNPALTTEGAYLQQLQAHPELQQALADERHARDQRLMLAEVARRDRVLLGEALGRKLGAVPADA
jgi:hypothetical protein